MMSGGGTAMLTGVLLHRFYDGPFLLAWDIEPYIAFGLIFSAGLYALGLQRINTIGTRSVPRSWPVAFFMGLVVFAFALAGPLHTYNEDSFALHMTQHVSLMLIAAPLLVLGRPVQIALMAISPARSGAVMGPFLRRGFVRTLLTAITNPIVVLLLLNVNLVIWHFPGFYVAALESTLIHEIEHILFMGTALLFWWVIIDPVPRHHRVRPDLAIGLLFISGSVGDLVGLYLIFAPEVIYPFYLDTEPLWGMSQHADQRVGGVIMLVVGTIVYFGATFLLIARNYGSTEFPAIDNPVSEREHSPSTG
jgi:putative membrane protein